MSGRLCSAACAVFFARDLVAAAEAPERRDAHVRPVISEARLELGQGDVGHLSQHGTDQTSMGLGTMREPVAALRLGPGISTLPPPSLPPDRASRAHAKALGRRTAGQARIDGGQNAGS